ncbi:hypothetical protein ACFVIM_01465 [Streptomyces sp. NPDC057638]|uniref:hypothetical protein n=1 Tax=Streptomyces sp. NPDC057638 TaxID=3346190 RepID=UPI00367DF9AB
MTKVEILVDEDRLDITGLNVAFAGLRVTSASAELVNGFGGDLDELGHALREDFADGASWCRISNAVHTVTDGDAEVRLVSQPDVPTWHADYFHAGWGSREGALVPPEHRPQYASYVDRRHQTRESCLQGKDLRAAAAGGGSSGVDTLVRHHREQLTEWYAALDQLLRSVHTTEDEDIPEWITLVAKDELLNWHRTREYLMSAVLEYHHGDTGPRPETVLGNLRFDFSTVSVEMMPF